MKVDAILPAIHFLGESRRVIRAGDMKVDAILPAQPSWSLMQTSATRDCHATHVHATTRAPCRGRGRGAANPTRNLRQPGDNNPTPNVSAEAEIGVLAGLADLSNPVGVAPRSIGSQHLGTETFTDRETQAVSQREPLPVSPALRRPFGVFTCDRFDDQPEAVEQGTGERPISTGRNHLLRDLGPIGCATATPFEQCLLDEVGTAFPLEIGKNR